ncbi:hypothetical protein AB0L82_37395 [Nocardia sp. NPDC052001]|uniref:hypothetical protein n=1 Tax=Nocardia sp. NPDC052001 TaxID=3154853 RepID=UPI00344107A3
MQDDGEEYIQRLEMLVGGAVSLKPEDMLAYTKDIVPHGRNGFRPPTVQAAAAPRRYGEGQVRKIFTSLTFVEGILMAPNPPDTSGSIPVSALKALHDDGPIPPAAGSPTVNGQPVDPLIAAIVPSQVDQKSQQSSTPPVGGIGDVVGVVNSKPSGTTLLPSGTLLHNDVTNDKNVLTTHTTIVIPGQSPTYTTNTQDLTPYLSGSQKLPTEDSAFNRLWDQLTPEQKIQTFQHDADLGNRTQLPLATRDYFNRLHDQAEISNYSAQVQQMRAQHPDWAQADDDAGGGRYSYMDTDGSRTRWLRQYDAAKNTLGRFTEAGKPGTILIQLDDNGNSVSVALPQDGQIPANSTVIQPPTTLASGPGATDVGGAAFPGAMGTVLDAQIAQERNRLEANNIPVPGWMKEITIGGKTVGGTPVGTAASGGLGMGLGVLSDMAGDGNSFDKAMARETGALVAFNTTQGVVLAGTSALTAALAGSETGAALGSVLPGVGTAVGLVAGAVAGYLVSRYINNHYDMPDHSNVVLPASVLQPPQQHATGGAVTGPGSSIGDKIPALLSDGEFVVNAASASQNRPLLRAINADPAYMTKYSQQMERMVAAALTKVRATPNGGGEHVNQSMTVRISTYDVHEAFAKAKLWEQRHTLTDF